MILLLTLVALVLFSLHPVRERESRAPRQEVKAIGRARDGMRALEPGKEAVDTVAMRH